MARGLAVWVAAAVACAVANASPAHLRVDSDGCNLAALPARLAKLIDPGARATVAVSVHALEARVLFDDGAGDVIGPRVIRATSCSELVDSVFVVIAMALPELATQAVSIDRPPPIEADAIPDELAATIALPAPVAPVWPRAIERAVYGETLSSGTLFLAKYSTTGQLVWVGGLGSDVGMWNGKLVIDRSGHISMCGSFGGGTLTLGSASYAVPPNDEAGFVIQFDASGTQLWGTAFPGDGMGGPIPQAIALDSDDDVIVFGSITMPATVGGATLTPPTPWSSFLTRFRNDGLYIASRLVNDASYQSVATGVTVDAANHVVVQQGQSPFNLGSASAQETLDAFDDNDQQVWSVILPDRSAGEPQVRTLVAMPSGYVVSGQWDDSPYNDGDPASVTGDMGEAAVDASGNATAPQFGRRMIGALAGTAARGAAAGANGTLAYVGLFSGELEVANTDLKNPGTGDTDAFVVLLAPASAGRGQSP